MVALDQKHSIFTKSIIQNALAVWSIGTFPILSHQMAAGNVVLSTAVHCGFGCEYKHLGVMLYSFLAPSAGLQLETSQ